MKGGRKPRTMRETNQISQEPDNPSSDFTIGVRRASPYNPKP